MHSALCNSIVASIRYNMRQSDTTVGRFRVAQGTLGEFEPQDPGFCALNITCCIERMLAVYPIYRGIG